MTSLIAAIAVTMCSRPDAPAQVQTMRVAEVLPSIHESFEYAYPWSGSARVRVDLDGRGSVRDAGVATSTGNPWLDRAALQAAREARYVAQTRNCANVGGSYLIVINFEDVT